MNDYTPKFLHHEIALNHYFYRTALGWKEVYGSEYEIHYLEDESEIVPRNARPEMKPRIILGRQTPMKTNHREKHERRYSK